MNKKERSKIDTSAEAAEPTTKDEPVDPAHTTRRRVLEWSSFILGSLVALIPAGLGLATFFDPWMRRHERPKSRERGALGKEGFIRVASLDALQIGGAPQRFPVIADQIDAWNYSPDQPVGAVFLQRTAADQVICFNATCPHAGCSVSHIGQSYVCPCHNSSFNLDGSKQVSQSGRENPSPRNLDSLEIDNEKLASNEVWVKFMNFYTGKHDKVPKS